MTKVLIVNADDFGLSKAVNRGIERAHLQGILTSATILANGPAFEDAVEVARRCPKLGVGVHLNVIRGEPVSSADDVEQLVDDKGRFRHGSMWLGMRSCITRFKRSVEREYREQVEKVIHAGIKPTHLDSEKHHASWGCMGQIACKIACEYAIPRIRQVKEPVMRELVTLPLASPMAIARAAGLRILTTLFSTDGINVPCPARYSSRGIDPPVLSLLTPGNFFGQMHIGGMTEEVWLRLLASLPEGVSEVMTHPGEYDEREELRVQDIMGPAWIAKSRSTELEALISPRVKQAAANGIKLANFGTAW